MRRLMELNAVSMMKYRLRFPLHGHGQDCSPYVAILQMVSTKRRDEPQNMRDTICSQREILETGTFLSKMLIMWMVRNIR